MNTQWKINWDLFARDMESEIRRRNVKYKQLARVLHISDNTVGRMTSGEPVSADSFMSGCHWMGANPMKYFAAGTAFGDNPTVERTPTANFLDRLRAANIARQAEWQERVGAASFPLSFRGLELAGECGEFCNILKKFERQRLGYAKSSATFGDATNEAADIAICLDLACMELGIDLTSAIVAKFNDFSDRHGLSTKLESTPLESTSL